MDELTLLRKVREDVAEPSVTALNVGRAALLDAAAPTMAKPATRHRVLRRAGWTTLAVVVAGGVAAILVFTNVVGLAGWRGSADPAAADTLAQAAAATIATADPVVASGQYLEVSTLAVYASISDTSTYLEHQDGQMYIPADRHDEWVWVRDAETVAKTFGPASEKQAAEDAQQPGAPDIIRAADGAFYNGEPMDWGLTALPRDPRQLLNYIYRTTAGQGTSPDGEALAFIADTLRTGVVPADLRAALYKALAGIPGVSISDRDATLDGRTGVAFGRNEGNGLRQEIIIDPSTGLLIGEREVVLRDGILPGVPAGESMGWTAVTTTVVDAAPAGGTLCGSGMHPVGSAGSGQCSGAGK
ncbi:MAG TPA: CU044_5270 family protein [Pseudolysinimonas sp.]|jgi:RNA polymerase sigma-70 factor (ECF subfamily)